MLISLATVFSSRSWCQRVHRLLPRINPQGQRVKSLLILMTAHGKCALYISTCALTDHSGVAVSLTPKRFSITGCGTC